MQSIWSAYYYLTQWKKPSCNPAAARKVIEVTNKNTHRVSRLDWIKPKAFLQQKCVQKSYKSSLSFMFLERAVLNTKISFGFNRVGEKVYFCKSVQNKNPVWLIPDLFTSKVYRKGLLVQSKDLQNFLSSRSARQPCWEVRQSSGRIPAGTT